MRRAPILGFAGSLGVCLVAYACSEDKVNPDSAVDAGDDGGPLPDSLAPGNDARPPSDAGPDTADAFTCNDAIGDGVPPDLRCTGLYSDWATKTVAPENKPYTPGLVFWSDGAQKTRWIYLPPGTKIDTSNMDEWVFPVGTKVWKEFRLGGARVETRLFTKRASDAGSSDLNWGWTTYRWSADESSAPRQDDAVTNVNDAGYEIPEHLACLQCHQGRLDILLGVEAVNLGNAAAVGITLAALADAGLLTAPPSSTSISIPEDVTGKAQAAIGWLHVNCGTACHSGNPNAEAQGSGLFMKLSATQLMDASTRVQDTDPYTTAVNKPCHMSPYCAIGGYLRIAAGDVAHSLEVKLAETRDGGSGLSQMPPIVTHQVDEAGTAKLEAWVGALPEGGL
jgi:hypothetical protein